MPFSETTTLVNNDSKIRVDVESIARITLSEIQYILETLNNLADVRHKSFLLEVAVTKTATVFQLAMRACDYLEKPDFKKSIIAEAKKGAGSFLGTIGSLREEQFHNGHSIIASERYYPFANIKGRGYVGIYVRQGATLRISDFHTFHSSSCEYAITSDGIYQIDNAGTVDENWHLLGSIFNIETIDIDNVLDAINGAVTDLKVIWKDLRDIRLKGDGTHEYRYLNEGGALELLEKGKEKIATYNIGGQLRVQGDLTITPPDGIKVHKGKLTYFVGKNFSQQDDEADASGTADL